MPTPEMLSTVWPSMSVNCCGELVVRRWTASLATVLFGTAIVATARTLAGVTVTSMSDGVTPRTLEARRSVKELASNESTFPARVNSDLTLGLYAPPGCAGRGG